MKKIICFIALAAFAFYGYGQKVDSIYFHLYTDSLKKGVYNYINVDGKLPGGRYIPLDTSDIRFASTYGVWQGNSLIIDSSFSKDFVEVTAVYKRNPAVKEKIIIYIKKLPDDTKVMTEQELLDQLQKKKRKRG